jgi:hypothetical protein
MTLPLTISSVISGPEHVPRYHEWMKDVALLEATGSEPLSFQEEIEMQQSWRDDPNKCTFIIHTARVLKSFDIESSMGISSKTVFHVNDNIESMVGDVNLFLSEIDSEREGDTLAQQQHSEYTVDTTIFPKLQQPRRLQAEIDIMIAEQNYRGKGLGRAATCGGVGDCPLFLQNQQRQPSFYQLIYQFGIFAM